MRGSDFGGYERERVVNASEDRLAGARRYACFVAASASEWEWVNRARRRTTEIVRRDSRNNAKTAPNNPIGSRRTRDSRARSIRYTDTIASRMRASRERDYRECNARRIGMLHVRVRSRGERGREPGVATRRVLRQRSGAYVETPWRVADRIGLDRTREEARVHGRASERKPRRQGDSVRTRAVGLAAKPHETPA